MVKWKMIMSLVIKQKGQMRMKSCIINGRIVLKDGVVTGKAIVFEDKIIKILEEEEALKLPDVTFINAEGKLVMPGLVDVHRHGCGGDDTSNNSEGAIQRMSRLMVQYGTTSWLPTTMTMPLDYLRTTFGQIRQAMKESKEDPKAWGGSQVVGANMEGPFINIARKGAQNGDYVVRPDVEYMKEFEDVIRLVTIASEVEGGLEFVEKVSGETTIHCSLGHTMANYEDARKCFAAGADHVTHLFNAQSGLHHRDPGVVGAALGNSKVYTELICDTFHIHPGVFQIVCDCKKDHLVLITDSMEAGGLPDGEYALGGQKVYKKGIECRLSDGTIAGSVLNLNEGVRNLYRNTNWDIAQCVNAASLYPAASIGVDDVKGSLEEGKDADIVIADDEFNIINTYVGGVKVYG